MSKYLTIRVKVKDLDEAEVYAYHFLCEIAYAGECDMTKILEDSCKSPGHVEVPSGCDLYEPFDGGVEFRFEEDPEPSSLVQRFGRCPNIHHPGTERQGSQCVLSKGHYGTCIGEGVKKVEQPQPRTLENELYTLADRARRGAVTPEEHDLTHGQIMRAEQAERERLERNKGYNDPPISQGAAVCRHCKVRVRVKDGVIRPHRVRQAGRTKDCPCSGVLALGNVDAFDTNWTSTEQQS